MQSRQAEVPDPDDGRLRREGVDARHVLQEREEAQEEEGHAREQQRLRQDIPRRGGAAQRQVGANP